MIDLTTIITIPTHHVAVRAVQVDGQWVAAIEWQLPAAQMGQGGEVQIAAYVAQEAMAYALANSGEEIEAAVLKAAWVTGAWDCVRWLHYPRPDADPFEPGQGYTRAFRGFDGVYAVSQDGVPIQSTFPAGSPLGFCNPDDLVRAAAENGYVAWSFQPMAERVDNIARRWQVSKPDVTLGERWWRPGPCPLKGFPLDERCECDYPCAAHSAIYRMGRTK